jgi:uncharacterized phage protein (TIGR02218 family)
MAKAILANMQTHLDGEVTSLATCWAIERRDGVRQLLTDHDRDITLGTVTALDTPHLRWMMDTTYLSTRGFERKALTNKISATNNSELIAILNSDGVTSNDLQAGLYDGARVYIFAVNWADLTDGIIKMPGSGVMGEVVLNIRQGTYEAEVRGLGYYFQNKYGDHYMPTCRVDPFSPRCRLDESLYVQHGVINTVTDNRTFTAKDDTFSAFTDTALTVTNSGFETDASGTVTPNITGWTGTVEEDGVDVGMWRVIQATNPLPSEGVKMLQAAFDTPHTKDVEFEITSDAVTITLGGPGPVAADIDAGEAVIDLEFAASVSTNDSTVSVQCRVALTFLDTNGEVINKKKSPIIRKENHSSDDLLTGLIVADAVIPLQDFTRRFSVPSLARTFQIHLIPINKFTADIELFWDDIRATVKAITVLAVGVDRDSGALTDWFDHGLITMTGGPNAGISREIETYDDATDDEITLFFPLPFTPAVGDTFEIYAGCKHRHAEDCSLKFDNSINFQGEPYVPNEDELDQEQIK